MNKADISEICDLQVLTGIIENAFIDLEKGHLKAPDRMHIETGMGTHLLMPTHNSDAIATKLVSVFPENKGQNIPVIHGLVILQNAKTGEILAMMDGGVLTAYRTGAIGAVGAKYTAPGPVRNIGIIGAGVQGYYQALFLVHEKKPEVIWFFDIDRKQSEDTVERLKARVEESDMKVAGSVEELMKNSHLIVAATTSKTPVIPDELRYVVDRHFIGVGSFKQDMQEMPRTLFRELKQIFIDSEHALQESGDLIHPISSGCLKIDEVIPIGKLILGEAKITQATPSFFKSAGMAVFDLVTAEYIYKQAVESGRGVELEK